MLKFFHKIRLLLKKKALNKCVYKKCKILQVHFTNIRIGTIKKKKNIYCTFTKESWTDNGDVFI